nr:spectrin beta chain, non-erythrocytic 2 isoform X2 [Parasteatoda tepidariorum]
MSIEHAEAAYESLRLERLNVQKKTFTKWANLHLQKYGLQIDDLFQDLGDGLRLMKLLESLTGEKLGKPAKGPARINKIENVSRCLAFLHSKKMRLENISSEDIVDGKPHLILGLLWTIILRCEISKTANETETDYTIPPPPPDQTYYPIQKIAKESLLLWCQTKTDGYPNVRVRDFHRSWRDGLAFNALIHSHVPALVNFQDLKKNEHKRNLENAFDIAQKHIGVPRLLDPEDIDTANPDEKSIIIYVSTFSKGLDRLKVGITGGKRIANVMQKMMEIDKMKQDYDNQASELLEWIHSKVYEFKYMPPLDSLESIQQEIISFKEYRTKEKPLKNQSKNEIEALLFAIQMKRLGKNVWIPPDDSSPAEIEKAWSDLEHAEYQHEIDVREQLKEQEKLENLAYKFEKKRAVRESFLNDMRNILMDPNYGSNIKQADATFKKHEAIRTGIVAREIMIKDFVAIADTLIQGNYREKEKVIEKKNEIETQWNYVIELLKKFDEKFANLRKVMSILEEMDSLSDEMNQMQVDIESESEPLDLEASSQNHAVREVQITSWGEYVRRLDVKVLSQEKTKDVTVLKNQLAKLKEYHQSLVQVSNAKRVQLDDLIKRKEQLDQIEEIYSWIHEKHQYCSSDVNCKDLASALLLQKKHKFLGSEIQLQKDLSSDIQDLKLQRAFDELKELYDDKSSRIDHTVQFHQYSVDADEAESWISEQLHILLSLDYGTDELTCEALSRRHVYMQQEIAAYSSEIGILSEEARKISESHSPQRIQKFSSANLLSRGKQPSMSPEYSGIDSVSDQVTNRQTRIEKAFSELQQQCEERQKRLQHNNMYFRVRDGCQEMESWMRQKEHDMNASNFEEEADKMEKSFEAFLRDLAYHGLVIDELKNLTEQLEEENAEQAPTAKILFDDAYRRWKHLHDLTSFKERNLKGFTSLMLAHRTCDETIAFLDEKSQSQGSELVEEIKNLDTLRRRQEAVQRELEPAEERLKQALVLAENVSNSYPDQKEQIQRKVKDLNEKWGVCQLSIKERKQKLEETAGLQIFKNYASDLLEWSYMMVTKLNVREKIGDLGVVDNVIKEHHDVKDEISTQMHRFEEAEELGNTIQDQHAEVRPLLAQLEESKATVSDLWVEKEVWLQQKRDLHLFNKETDHLQRLCSTQSTLLISTEQRDTLSDAEILLRHLETLVETMKAQESRFNAYEKMSDSLIDAGHTESEYIKIKKDQTVEQREKVKQLAENRKNILLDIFEFQEFKADAFEMNTWILEKTKLAKDLTIDISVNLPYKMKRQQTFEAEISANRDRLTNTLLRGETLVKDNTNVNQNEVASILEELGNSWNELIDLVELNQSTLQKALALRDFSNSVEQILKKLNELIKAVSSTNYGKDLRSVKSLIKDLETVENEKSSLLPKISLLVGQGNQLIEANCEEEAIQKLLTKMTNKSDELEKPLAERRQKLETCLKFYQFKSDVEREQTWISEQMVLLSTVPVIRNLLDAQKFQKKIGNLELAIENHKAVIENLQEKVLLLVTEDECPVDVTQPSILMKEQWTQLLKEFNTQKEKANISYKAQSFYSEAADIDAWIAEKLEILTNADYGKDEDAVIKLLTKHKALELEIDSYKGLVDELGNQAENLIESNHPDSKIIKNRMDVINQEMKNLQKLCTVKRQKLLESKSRYEFENETEELKEWIAEQIEIAASEDYGEDYEHVLVLNQNFEFFKTRVESGSKRVMQYEEFAKRLINSNCYFVTDVRESLDYLSARWLELVESIEARSFKMEAASEIHRYHRDVTDILSRIHGHYRTIPQELGNNLNQVQDLLKKHDNVENELLGIEAQVHILLKDSQRLQEVYPGGNEEHIQMQLALVVENWNLLQQRVSARKDQLLVAQQVHKFLATVREEETWAKSVCLDLDSGILSRDLQQLEKEHILLGDEIESRLARYDELNQEGDLLKTSDMFQSQVDEKLKSLSDICIKVRDAYNRRSTLIQQKKGVVLFFNDAKQIQAAIAQKEVQLCGSERKEIVEDISDDLKKHLEFQKLMETQEEKFAHWKEQGEILIKQHVEEAEKIDKKIEDLSERRRRLIDFSSERCRSLSEALQHAKFKRDTIEAEAWIQEKKNKLRLVSKDYNKLSDEEKIRCLQKQLAVQSELDAHESFINQIVQQSREFSPTDEAKTRLQYILEDWEEIKTNAAKVGTDLAQARDMLALHESFEKAESWIKEKELMIQANDVGKDYEHCMAIQSKLDDVNSDSKLDQATLIEMRNLATKLSRNDDLQGVYTRYEVIWDRWISLKEDMSLYRQKLVDAAQVHSFIRDVDDTIERIREKTLVLSSREEAEELSSVQSMQRKMEELQLDLTVLEKEIKKQEQDARILSELHELSSYKINDKMSQAQKEWDILQKELKEKKHYIELAHTSLKYVKDVNDYLRIINEIVAEIEFGELPSNSSDAQELLNIHSDIKAQITVRQQEINDLQEKGQQYLRQPGLAHADIEKCMQSLQETSYNLDNVWHNRYTDLMQCRDQQLFLEKTKQIENWLSVKEAFLANQDIGDSMSSVEALIRKHENFEETCTANFEKIREIELMARDLRDHHNYEQIEAQCDEICRRRDTLQENCKRRKKILEDAKTLQKFLLDMYEITHWMDEKIRVASDDSYRDLTNLLSKTQKHMAFEAEIMANHSRVVDFTKQAEKLIQENHFASTEIKQHAENVENQWEQLLNASNLRKEKLMEASDALQFTRKLEDVHYWLEEAEGQILFEDYDANYDSLQQQLHQIQELQREAEENSDTLRYLGEVSEEFQQANHFSKDNIAFELKEAIQRYRSVENGLHEKSIDLEGALWLSELEKDINDELSWIEENIKLCESDEYYDDIMTIQAFQKNLQALETEIISREPLISSVVERGRRAKGEAAEEKVNQLEQRFQVLKDAASLRRLRLADALEAQKYFFEANQAEIWVKEKLSQVIGYNIEPDVYSVQAIQKKLNAVDAASAAFRSTIQNLEDISASLIARNHFDCENIQKKQDEVTDHFEELRRNILKKTAVLKEKEEYFLYEKEVKHLIAQLKAMSGSATLSELGRDVEHVETLLQKFELFSNKLRGYEMNVAELEVKGNYLIEQGHMELESVNEILKDLNVAWLKCKEAVDNRQQVLEREKLVHTFYKSVDETESWINEKDVALSSQDYGHDLESIKTLSRHHETVEGDLKAIEEQIQALDEEATELKKQFPDSKGEIEDKHQTVQISWMKCKEKSTGRKDKLLQSEQLQSYFDEARDFHAWVYEMSALLTNKDLPQEVSACEALLAQHEGYKSEIDTQMRSFYVFEARGKEIIDSGHFLSHDVETKVETVSSSFKELLETWEKRKSLYEQNLDLQLFKKKLIGLETWLSTQEHNLNEENGRSIEEVDYLIQRHEQFEKKLELYNSKFQELLETTKVERKASEDEVEREKKRIEEEKKEEQQRLEEIRRKEEERLLEERQKERVPTGVSEIDYDGDYLNFENSLSEEPKFTRIGSRRSLRERPGSVLPRTPVIGKRESIIPEIVEEPPTYVPPKELPPTTAEGFLARKQEVLSGGKRSTMRQWKSYYTVLCGQLLCFFKDKKMFQNSKAASPPVNILKANCFIPSDYHKKKYVFRLEVSDRSAFLFEALSDIKRQEWMQKIKYAASLPPNRQLTTAYDQTSYSRSKGQKQAPPAYEEDRYERYDDVDVEESQLYANVGRNSLYQTEEDDESIIDDQFRLRTLSEDSHGVGMSDEDRRKSSIEDSWFKRPVERKKSKEHFIGAGVSASEQRKSSTEDNWYKKPVERKKHKEQYLSTGISDDDQRKSSTEENWFKKPLQKIKSKEHLEDGDNKFGSSSEEEKIKPDEFRLSNVFEVKSVGESFYDDPFAEARQSFSAESYDHDSASARSSVSNTSSYVTAVAGSTSSLSTLRDERIPDLASSEDEQHSYTNPHPTPRGTISTDEVNPAMIAKHQSLTLDPGYVFKKVEKPKPKKKWYSLRSRK